MRFFFSAAHFSYFPSSEIRPLCFFISRSSSLSVIHVSVDIKIKSKKRLGLVAVFRLSKNPGGLAIYRQNARVSEVRNFTPGLHGRVDIRLYVRTINVLGAKITKFSYPWCSAARFPSTRAPI